jgi:hypothetical protein
MTAYPQSKLTVAGVCVSGHDDSHAGNASSCAHRDGEVRRRPHGRRQPESRQRERCVTHGWPTSFSARFRPVQDITAVTTPRNTPAPNAIPMALNGC